MYDSKLGLYVAHCEQGPISICGQMANRHGLIAGATGTGKTVSLQTLAETFSQAGVPCFMADMKGDLSGVAKAGKMSEFIKKRCAQFGIEDPEFEGCPVRFYDVFGEKGHPMRTTISDMGPQLLSRLLSLNEIQAGVMDIVFRVADDRGLLLLDLKDLRAMLKEVSENAQQYAAQYGSVSSASVGAIQRALLSLENEGADKFFGEPSFEIEDLFDLQGGKGVLSVLAADKLMLNPKLYSTFLLWLLSEIYETLPEVGDRPLPRLVFFFDEAHTLFTDTAPALVAKIEQVIRLIRSKGVGVYFITQSPTDIPEAILGQLGNRIQHALRAYTPKDQKAVKAAAETFRANPSFKTADAIMELGTGEALVSFLGEDGTPAMVQRAKMLFPLSQIGALTEGERLDAIKSSSVYGKYDTPIDRESAFEVLLADREKAESEQQAILSRKQGSSKKDKEGSTFARIGGAVLSAAAGAAITSVTRSAGTAAANALTGKKSKSTSGKSIANKAITNATSSALRTLTRSILGSLIK